MSRVIWGILFLAALALSGFLLYLTLTRPDVPARGFVLAAGILAVGGYPLFKIVKGAPAEEPADEQEPKAS